MNQKERKTLQKNIDKAEAELSAFDGLYADIDYLDLPDPKSICWHDGVSTVSEFTFSYEFAEIEDAYALIDSWGEFALPLFLTKSGCTSFHADVDGSKHHTKKDKSTPISRNYTVGVSTFGFDFSLYAIVEGHLISVKIGTGFRTGWEKYLKLNWQEKYMNPDKLKSGTIAWIVSPHFGDTQPRNPSADYELIHWASGTHDGIGNKTLYWIDEDEE